MDSPRLDRVLRFKNNSMRGGTIEHVYMRDVTVGEVAEAVVTADFFYEEGEAGGFTPVLRDVEVRSVTSRKSKYAFYLRGFARAPIVGRAHHRLHVRRGGPAGGRRIRAGSGLVERPDQRPTPERTDQPLASRKQASGLATWPSRPMSAPWISDAATGGFARFFVPEMELPLDRRILQVVIPHAFPGRVHPAGVLDRRQQTTREDP